jgi:allophanate hydrolase subunit 2
MRIRLRLGPRDYLFGAASAVFGSVYTVAEGNRVGLRLRGAPMVRADSVELPSEGLIAGAVQVPPDGQPLIFLADHPTTGGYPVLGAVHPADLQQLAQARPGTRVVFHGSQRGPR